VVALLAPACKAGRNRGGMVHRMSGANWPCAFESCSCAANEQANEGLGEVAPNRHAVAGRVAGKGKCKKE